jgi:hypothetical protein
MCWRQLESVSLAYNFVVSYECVTNALRVCTLSTVSMRMVVQNRQTCKYCAPGSAIIVVVAAMVIL